jgi:hypothetical protein
VTIAIVCLVLCACPEAEPPRKQHVDAHRVYTNEDLDRLAPYRGQTGVLSTPAASPAPPAREVRPGRGEAYWRREAERVRRLVRGLEERAAELRLRIAEQQAVPRSQARSLTSRSAPSVRPAWEARLQSLERRIREEQAGLEDRARRDGALPGWLR